LTGEVIQVNRKGTIVEGYFEKVYDEVVSATGFLISDKQGVYGEVVDYTSAKIMPAAANRVKFQDAHGEERKSVPPSKDGKQYKIKLPEIAFMMFDTFGNAISSGGAGTGEFTITSSNAKVAPPITSDRKAIPGRKDKPYGYVELTYETEGDTAFAGEDNIEANFTKPGLGSNVLSISAAIPALQKLSNIASYIETTDIPVNSEVVMTVETLDEDDNLLKDDNTTVTITFGAEVGDTIVPRVKLNEIRDANGNVVESEKQVSTGESISFENKNGRVVFVIEAGPQEGIFTIKFADANNTIEEVRTFNVTEKLEILAVSPTTVENLVTDGTASVTITGGVEPYTVVSEDESIATATLEDDGTTVTITGQKVADDSVTTVTITDSKDGVSKVTVTVSGEVNIDQCHAEGHVFVDDECKQLPSTNGGSGGAPTIDSDGNFGTSNANFSGGWSEDGAAYGGTVSYDAKAGKPVSVTQVIRFDPSHSGEVDIVVLLDIRLHPFGPDLWFVVSLASGFEPWDLSMASIVPFDTHTIVSGEPLVLGPYDLGTGLKDFLASDVKFYFGYRISDGTMIFSGDPINLQVR
jgi:hypothetical protein